MRTILSRDACRSCWPVASLALCLSCLEPLPTQAQILFDHTSPVEITECGQVVVTDAVLVQNLVCEAEVLGESAISIGASDITLDLGGHAVFGNMLGIGINAHDAERVTIKNGTIDGFRSGIDIPGSRDVTVENVTIRNLGSDNPEDFISGLWIAESQDVLVQNSTLEFLPVAHKNGILLNNAEGTVDNIEMNGGGCGVDINFGSRGSVINSRFVGVTIAGVLVQHTDNARVADNEFIRCETGVAATGDYGAVTGLTVERNSIHDGFRGIQFAGNSDSSILDNVISGQWQGIGLDMDLGCMLGVPGHVCFYATGNLIAGNEVVGNVTDLYHHESAAGNTWERNTCLKKEGAEIPPCPRLRRRLEPLPPPGPPAGTSAHGVHTP